MALNLKTRASSTSGDGDQSAQSGPPLVRTQSSKPSLQSTPVESPEVEMVAVTPITASDILADQTPIREFILLAGKDGVGKSCAVVSMAKYVQDILDPLNDRQSTFYVIDSENKFRTALRTWGPDAPTNIVYYKVETMNHVTWAVNDILAKHQPWDWLAVESMSRIWERAQDLGYMAVSGYTKVEYMEERAKIQGKKPGPTPSPDQLWSVTKGAHDGAFLDRITLCDDLNVMLTTTMSKPPKQDGFMKENQDRRAMRAELGIDAGIEGAPRIPYFAESLCLLELNKGKVSCRILRDNLSARAEDDTRPTFDVDSKKSFANDFFLNCRS